MPKRRGSTYTSAVPVARARSARACAAARPADRTAAPRSSAGARAGSDRPTAPRSGTCRHAAGAPRARRVSSASSTAGASGRDQRGSRISTDSIVAPSRCGASWRRIVSTSGSSGTSAHAALTFSRIRTTSTLALRRTSLRETRRVAPASHVSTLAPTSASGPSWRREPCPRRAASSGAYSRV